MVQATMIPTETQGELQTLVARVRRGNEVLNESWERAKGCVDTDRIHWNKIMDAIEAKYPLLLELTLELQFLGYRECLFNDGRSCFTQDGWFCWSCPKEKISEVAKQ